MQSLPVDALLPELVESLRRNPNLVLEAPPGAGKTTRVPPALWAAGWSEVLVLEPRRLAARLAARRVALELGERVGETAGYHVRFESFAGEKTRIRFLTEGVLTRRLLADPELRGAGAVVLDEFHERHLEGDLALALLRRLQLERRPELRLVVMSATLESGVIASYLGGCPVMRSEGRQFALSMGYTPHSAETLETRVAGAVERVLREEEAGDVLVFLPGAAEIRRCQRAIRASALVLPLYGDLAPEEQDRAVEPGPAGRRKVILSTNVAESSVTIEGVRAVVDTGLARVARDNRWTGLPRVEVQRVVRSAAIQRAGRAARTGPGRVIRLYTEEDFLRRPMHDEPEIARRELAQLCLDLHAAGLRDPAALPWLDAPPEAALRSAEEMLGRLGALDGAGGLTPFGRELASLPLHPRLAALALHGGGAGISLAARLSSGNRGNAAQVEEQLRREFRRRPKRAGAGRHGDGGGMTVRELPKAILLAFPDRAGRRRKGNEVLLCGGVSAVLASGAGVEQAEFLVALDIEERPEQGPPLIRQASAMEPDWLLELFPEQVTARETVEWNRTAERVEAVSALVYDQLVLEETRGALPEPEQAAGMLAVKAAEAGLQRFADPDEIAALRDRAAFAGLEGLDAGAALRALCVGLRSFAELEACARGGGLERAMLELAGKEARERLARLAPEWLTLPSGRRTRVNYTPGQAPWVASRLQDFFGMRETPRIGQAGVALTVHLLAPNRRPVQMTQDLAGFWERLYPQVRKELSRRYPRHAWPENPYNTSKD